MDKKMYGITLLNLEDVQGLFDTVDRCKEPVYMVSGDHMMDLQDQEVREILRSSQMEGEEIPRLKLFASCQTDTIIIANFMMCGRRSA